MLATLRILALAVLVAPVLVTPVLAEAPQEVAAQPEEARVTLDDLLTPAANVGVEGACNTPEAENAAAAFCPYGGPECVEHDDCDDFCGSPEFGYCEILGHFPTGCCLCLG